MLELPYNVDIFSKKMESERWGPGRFGGRKHGPSDGVQLYGGCFLSGVIVHLHLSSINNSVGSSRVRNAPPKTLPFFFRNARASHPRLCCRALRLAGLLRRYPRHYHDGQGKHHNLHASKRILALLVFV